MSLTTKTRFFLLLLVLSFLTCCVRPVPLGLEVDVNNPQKLERGRYLTETLSACGHCHFNSQTNSLSGGRTLEDRYGPLLATNLTPAEDGLKHYNLSEFMAVFRKLKSKKTEYLSGEFHIGLDKMSNSDLSAIFVYLKSLAPVKSDHSRRLVSDWEKVTIGFSEDRRRSNSYIFAPDKSNPKEQLKYGKYLVDNVASCVSCHQIGSDDYLGGGRKVSLTKVASSKVYAAYAPALRKSLNVKIANWTKQDYLNYLLASNGLCPTEYYAQANSSDLQAIATYLVSLK